MGIIMLVMVAVGLSVDAMAVAMINSVCYGKMTPNRLWAMPLFFGFFQSLMPFLGILLGQELFYLIGDKMALFTLVVFLGLGLKMLYEGRTEKDESCNLKGLTYPTLLLQAIMTSLDAFAVGFLFVSTKTPMPYVLLIGLVTFILVALVMGLARHLSGYLGNKAHFVGGGLFIMLGLYQFFF